jgi:succinate-semialdehyde dehydrogenase/glutarate-semialdehyde dehydrogenase
LGCGESLRLEGLDEQVRRPVEMGARVLTGGKRLGRPGNYYAPTVLADVPKDAPAYREELFGPVAALFRTHGIEAAIRLANDTEFGLGASAWTMTQPSSSDSSTTWKRAWCSSTGWWHPTRGCRSAA